MNIKKEGDLFLVESSTKGKYYNIDIANKKCDCPHFIYRMQRIGGECKHIKAVKDLLYNDSQDDFDKAIEFIRINSKVDSLDFIEKFNEKILDELKNQGEIIEEKGMLKIMK